MELYDFEKVKNINEKKKTVQMTDAEINLKYENGEQRIVTEQGSYKLNLLSTIFKDEKFVLQPEFQRRITWDIKKRSRLIESFIMNIPVPPIFLYEEDYSTYVVMDGLQRISAIMDYYNDNYALAGLEEWPELNGKKYSQLPQKIKEGIDRRQLSAITLLKESTGDMITADKMKKIVFERLNTGGVQLEDQEIRNALCQGPFNTCCIELSYDTTFRQLWGLDDVSGNEDVTKLGLDDESNLLAAKNRFVRRMYDVELVLRYFAMRTVSSFNGNLSQYLDMYLEHANSYSNEEIELLKKEFKEVINLANNLFGDKAFCMYKTERGWTQPQNMIYDAILISLGDERVRRATGFGSVNENIVSLKEFYLSNDSLFNGRKQSKKDIITRVNHITEFLLRSIVK